MGFLKIINKISFKKVLITLIILLVLFILYIFIEPYWIEIKEINIVSEDIPKTFENQKIIFLSDIHHGPFVSIERVKDVVDKVNNINPDILLFGGDFVYKDRKYIIPCFDELKKLKSSIKKFGVLGNHDHWKDPLLTKEKMKEAGIICLDNKSEWITVNSKRIKIGGVGDLWEDKQDISQTIKDVKKEDFVILLSHNPDYVEKITTNKIDLVISGHSHGGQVTLFGFWTPFTNSLYGQKYRTGIIEGTYTKTLVSNGIGTVIFPVRFFARPQIVVIKLKSLPK